MKVSEIMSKQVITVSVDTSIEEAAKVMASKNISSLVVLHHRQPVGILTERDIVREVVIDSHNPGAMIVKQVMKKNLPTISPDDPVMKVYDHIEKYQLRHFPVTRGRDLVGVVTESDVMRGFHKIEQELEESLLSGKLTLEQYSQKRKEFLSEIAKAKKQETVAGTGSKDLDSLLGGGYLRGTTVAIEGPPGSGKGLLGFLFLIEGLRNGERCVYIYMGDSVENIRNGFRAFGVDAFSYVREGKLSFIELRPVDSPSDDSRVASVPLDDAKHLIAKVREFSAGPGRLRLVMSTVSHQSMFIDSRALYRYVYNFSDHCRTQKWTALYLIEYGVNNPAGIISIEQLMDGIIEIKYKENPGELERMLLVKKMEGGRLVPQKFFACSFEPERGIIICPPEGVKKP